MTGRSYFAQLTNDHERLRDLVATLKVEQDPDELDELAEELNEKLGRHLDVEEQALYPRLLEIVHTRDDRVLLLGAHEDHRIIARLLDELVETPAREERFLGKMHAFERIWRHHVETEEGTLYDLSRKYLSHDEFTELTDVIKKALVEHRKGTERRTEQRAR